MAVKTLNRTIDEVERLTKLLDKELERINPNTLSESDTERLDEAFNYILDFNDSIFREDEEDEGEGEEDESF